MRCLKKYIIKKVSEESDENACNYYIDSKSRKAITRSTHSTNEIMNPIQSPYATLSKEYYLQTKNFDRNHIDHGGSTGRN